MNNKEIRGWVSERIVKGYEEKELREEAKNKASNEKELKKIIKEYETQKEELSGEIKKLGWIERWKLRKGIKALMKCTRLQKKILENINKRTGKITEREEIGLRKLKNNMIDGIMGSEKEPKKGLINIFEIKDEEGNLMTRKKLTEEYTLNEITNLLEELIQSLEREI